MSDGDDDEQVESHSEQRDGGQHNVKEQNFRPGRAGPPAG